MKGEPVGPKTQEELAALSLRGLIIASTPIIEEGGSSWTSYGRLFPDQSPPAPQPAPRISAPPAERTPKQLYLDRIRAESAYPTFRSFVNVIARIFYLIGGLLLAGGLICILAGLGGTLGNSGPLALVSFVPAFLFVLAGTIWILFGKIIKESSLMLADAADSLTEQASRSS